MNPLPLVEVPSGDAALFDFADQPGSFVNVDLDGAETTEITKKQEKLPMSKKMRNDDSIFQMDKAAQPKTVFSASSSAKSEPKDYDFLKPQPGVAPKFTGSFAQPQVQEEQQPKEDDFEYFNFGEGEGAVVNPAATYLDGGNFDKIAAPKCTMVGCTGPLPNDGSLSLDDPAEEGKACHQTFVPMNGCTDNKGYPMGMLCSICCDCSSDFVREMKATNGFKKGYTP